MPAQTLDIGNKTAMLDGIVLTLDIAQAVIGVEAVAIKIVAESFDYAADWDKFTETMILRLQILIYTNRWKSS